MKLLSLLLSLALAASDNANANKDKATATTAAPATATEAPAAATEAPATATQAPATATEAPTTNVGATEAPATATEAPATATEAPAAEAAGKGDIKGGATCGKILGQSGKIKVGKCAGEVLDQQDPGLVTITMDAVGEKDKDGKPLTGKWFNSFAPLDFTFEAIKDVTVDGVAAKRLDFLAEVNKNPVGKLGVIKVSTHFFLGAGQISNADGQESFNVTGGSMKFAVTVEGWEFCEQASPKGQADDGKNCPGVGEFVDLEISVTSAGGSKPATGGNATDSVDLGSATMDLSSWVKYGDKWSKMADGYPKVEGSLNAFRFAKADAAGAATMFYDPVITLGGADGGDGGADGGAVGVDSFSAALMLPVLLFAEL